MIKQYDKYRETGDDWIVHIPNEWELADLKWLSNIYAGGTPSTDIGEYWEGGTVPWLNSGAVNQKRIKTASDFITEKALQNSSAKWVPKGALVMALAGQGKTKGTVALLEIDATCNQSMAAIVPDEKKVKSDYLFYWLDCNYERIRGLAGDEQRDGLNLEIIGSICTPMPSSFEQTQIARFLDYQAALIDTIIAKKQKLIELLEEYRKSVINEAVTKGLNPQAPMKDSGVEWLGEVPEHWSVRQMKYIAELNPSKSEIPGGCGPDTIVSFLPMEKVGEDWSFDLTSTARLGDVSNGLTYFRNGDIIIAKITPCFENGKGALLANLVNSIGFGSTEFHTIRPGNVNARFLFYVTRSDYFMANGESFMTGSAGQKRVPTSFVNEFFVPLPMEVEQEEIATYLDEYINRSNFLVQQIKIQIEKLKEYRQSLISETVTGKIDVRDWEPPAQ